MLSNLYSVQVQYGSLQFSGECVLAKYWTCKAVFTLRTTSDDTGRHVGRCRAQCEHRLRLSIPEAGRILRPDERTSDDQRYVDSPAIVMHWRLSITEKNSCNIFTNQVTLEANAPFRDAVNCWFMEN